MHGIEEGQVDLIGIPGQVRTADLRFRNLRQERKTAFPVDLKALEALLFPEKWGPGTERGQFEAGAFFEPHSP